MTRLAALLGMRPADIHTAIDSNPGSAFDLVRVASDVDRERRRASSPRRPIDLPGVEVLVEARRAVPDGPLLSQILGYTGPVSPEQTRRPQATGYLPDDLIGKAGVERTYEDELRGTYGEESVERDAIGPPAPGPPDRLRRRAGASLDAHHRHRRRRRRPQKALNWAMKEVGLKRGVVIVMNPQTGEVLALVSLPTYDNNLFARGISNRTSQTLLNDPDKPLLNHATRRTSRPDRPTSS